MTTKSIYRAEESSYDTRSAVRELIQSFLRDLMDIDPIFGDIMNLRNPPTNGNHVAYK